VLTLTPSGQTNGNDQIKSF